MKVFLKRLLASNYTIIVFAVIIIVASFFVIRVTGTKEALIYDAKSYYSIADNLFKSPSINSYWKLLVSQKRIYRYWISDNTLPFNETGWQQFGYYFSIC